MSQALSYTPEFYSDINRPVVPPRKLETEVESLATGGTVSKLWSGD